MENEWTLKVKAFALPNNKILPANSNNVKQLIGKTFYVWQQLTNESATNHPIDMILQIKQIYSCLVKGFACYFISSDTTIIWFVLTDFTCLFLTTGKICIPMLFVAVYLISYSYCVEMY